MFHLVRIPGYGSLCTDLDTPWISSAQVANIDKIAEYFDGSDRTHLLACTTEIAHRRRNDHLSKRAYRKGLFRATHTVMFLALLADHRTVNTDLIQIQDLDSGLMVINPSCMEECADRFTLPASRAFTDVDSDHALILNYIIKFKISKLFSY